MKGGLSAIVCVARGIVVRVYAACMRANRLPSLLVWLTSAPRPRSRLTSFSPSLTLAAIIRGVQPLSSWLTVRVAFPSGLEGLQG